jgi:hypothetical protein
VMQEPESAGRAYGGKHRSAAGRAAPDDELVASCWPPACWVRGRPSCRPGINFGPKV